MVPGPGAQETDERAAAGAEAAALVQRIGAGERKAEDAFARRYLPGLLTLLRVRCQDPELAKDVAQDTLRVVLVRLRGKGLEDPAGLAGFVRGTALNLLANELRRSDQRLTDRASDWIEEVVAERGDPYETVADDNLTTVVRTLIDEMKVPRDRELLWRHYVLDEPKEKLCGAYDLSPEHFDRVLHRARQRLRELMMERGLAARR